MNILKKFHPKLVYFIQNIKNIFSIFSNSFSKKEKKIEKSSLNSAIISSQVKSTNESAPKVSWQIFIFKTKNVSFFFHFFLTEQM
jgi:hypothetical protein